MARTITIKLIKTWSRLPEGEIVELESAKAKRVIAKGYAVEWKAPKKGPTVETATINPQAETATVTPQDTGDFGRSQATTKATKKKGPWAEKGGSS